MRIGLDLDNTIIFYDEAFVRAAIERGLLPAGFTGTKQQLRDAIRLLKNGETEWQKLQGYVYGKGLAHAALFEGVEEFLKACKARGGMELFIVSHKTEFGHFDPDKVNLRDAAWKFLHERGFFAALGIKESNLHFAVTRGEKIDIIRDLGLDWFVDDLVEVYEEPDFPATIRKILFHSAPSHSPKGDWRVCKDWRKIREMLLANDDDVNLVAQKLTGQLVTSITQASGGGNSRIYKIIAGGAPYALKRYPAIKSDARDRLNVEKKALQFFEAHHIACTPRWLAAEPPFALMEWIEGEPVNTPTIDDIHATVDFLSAVFKLASDDMPPASEACLSGAEILRQLETRLAKLEAVDDETLSQFLTKDFMPEMQKRLKSAKQQLNFSVELPRAEQRLIPADFGFHNALRTARGLVFIDFEYFGWDDPVKLLCDFLLHPAMQLNEAMKERFYQKMIALSGENPKVSQRFSALYPLFGLRWTLILLNEFLPERWQARSLARDETDWKAVKIRQLKKARDMLSASAAFV